MANPYLPGWEYIPDGEPRVFGDRVYIYGSHDQAGNSEFCDWKLKCWSAPVTDPENWVCHGDIFHTRADRDHESDTPYTDKCLFAPDVVQGKDGRYYLYAYVVESPCAVAVSDKPEGPFEFLGQIESNIDKEITWGDTHIDPGVLVDDDGRTYMYCGYLRSYVVEINSDKMNEVVDDSCIEHIIPIEIKDENGFTSEESLFFEACSPRKVGDTYYLIYSPKACPRLAYATSKSPLGPFTYRGYIVDSGLDYPGGNNHGSIVNVNGQWYVFYHRMTNNSIMSRRGCVERIEILPDGTIPTVETTSLGFEESLNPYRETPADICCVLKNNGFVIERNVFERAITEIKEDTVIGYKYFDFGEDNGSRTMEFAAKVNSMGMDATLHIKIDGEDGEEIGTVEIGRNSSYIETIVKNVTGRHSVFFTVSTNYGGSWTYQYFKDRCLFELVSFVFMK